jgi:hypothetical protein
MNCNKCEYLNFEKLSNFSTFNFVCSQYKKPLISLPYNIISKIRNEEYEIKPLDKCYKLRKEKIKKLSNL